MGLKTVKWLTISQFELREGRALRQTPSRRLQVLVSEHALRQTKLTPESHHRIACVTVRSEKQRRYPCSGPQPTQSITGSAFQISFYPDWQIDRGFFKRPIMACRQILAPLVHNWKPRTEFQRCFADGCNQILVASVAHDNQCIITVTMRPSKRCCPSLSSGLAEMIRKYSLLRLSPPQRPLCVVGPGGWGERRRERTGHDGKPLRRRLELLCESSVTVKHLIKNVSPTLLNFTKSTARFSKPSRKCARLFVVCGLDHITVPEMLETMHENDLFDMFPVFSNVVHILGVIPATLCDCVLQTDHSLRCQGRSQLFD